MAHYFLKRMNGKKLQYYPVGGGFTTGMTLAKVFDSEDEATKRSAKLNASEHPALHWWVEEV